MPRRPPTKKRALTLYLAISRIASIDDMQSFDPLKNCPGAGAMVKYLHSLLEGDRAALAKQLHDDLGGLMVAVVMDLAFVEQNLQLDDRLRERLNRVRRTMTEAIDLKRRITEGLRPSILENFGLFEALRRQVKHGCARTQIACSDSYPQVEPPFTKEAAIGLFRIAQDSLAVALVQPTASAAHVAIDVSPETLQIAVSCNGKPRAAENVMRGDTVAVCAIAHRVNSLGGRMAVSNLQSGGAVFSSVLPLAPLTTGSP